MDDEAVVNAAKAKGEATSKVKDGYVQLAEKMEQVKNQVAKIERKYDELYRTVKGKEHSRNQSIITETDVRDDTKSQRESIDEMTAIPPKPVEETPPTPTIPSPEVEDKAATVKKPSREDFEKMENNPFL